MITILTKAPEQIPTPEIIAAIRIETAIVNHCRANIHFGMDAERFDILKRTEAAAMDRIYVLQDMLS